jgi:alpha-tubulin suppressor-like RCC1 family protein
VKFISKVRTTFPIGFPSYLGWDLRLTPVNCADTGLTLSWGRGEDGQLGHGDAQERTTPCVVYALKDSGISKITCGAEYSIAISAENKELYSWGW